MSIKPVATPFDEERARLIPEFNALAERFPYMFQGRGIGMSIGWFPIFKQACEEVDAALGEDKLGFHWTQTKEKYGSASMYCYVKLVQPGEDATPENVARYLDQRQRLDRAYKAVHAAEDKTMEVCMVCGEPGVMDMSQHYVLTLCEHHQLTRNEWRDKGDWWIYPKKEWP